MYLNCKTYFSFKYGTYSTEQLVEAAVERGVDSLAITNINNTCDVWDFVDFCHQKNIKPIAGAEIRNDDALLYVLLARNNAGLAKINRFLSFHLHAAKPFPLKPLLNDDVFVIYPFHYMDAVNDLSQNELIGVQITEVNLLFNYNLSPHLQSKLVIRQPVTFQDSTYYNVHRLLCAMDKNILLSKQQSQHVAAAHETFISPTELINHFNRYPLLITNTLKLAEQCHVDIELHTDKTKKFYSATKEDDQVLLNKLAMDGFKKRYGPKNKSAYQRVVKELNIINELGFNAYFLITWDVIRYAKSKGFFYVGRGSGANSIVAYCLEITDVDPIELDLYFERFLNPYRSSPPDFDIDFSWKDRDEITAYIFSRFGKEHVCLLGSYVTFQKKAVIRELGKVWGLPKEEIDRLDAAKLNDDKIQRQIYYYGNLIQNFPSHLSIHAGGILISEAPVFDYTATFMPPKGFATSQIDMFIAEKIGLFKLDILSQRGLAHIKDAVEIVAKNKNIHIDIHDVARFKTDEKVAAQIKNADTIGCFYIESPGMRQLLKKLRCNDYITLVAASSIIRPGVAQSGMMRQYIQRFHHPDRIVYLHPKMEELLKETFGVMVFQEDVIKVAHHFAGLDMGEADVLRRAMSGKYRGHKHFEQIKNTYFENCKKRGYSEALAAEVWRQIESFGGYSFSKAHSASFAVESYQSLYLKTYFPKEFMVAVINNFGGFYSTELYFHELKKTGANIHGPCINNSEYKTCIVGNEVYMGFVHVQNLQQQFIEHFLELRKLHGPYTNLEHFIQSTSGGLEQVNILIRSGAFRFTGLTKKELLWKAAFYLKSSIAHSGPSMLFNEPVKQFKLPALHDSWIDDASDEMELLGFINDDIFKMVDENPDHYLNASSMPEQVNKTITVLGYLITSKPVRTVKKEIMYFHTFLDANGDWIDTVFFPNEAKRFPVNGRGFYIMKGVVKEEFGTFTLEVSWCKKAGLKIKKENLPYQLS